MNAKLTVIMLSLIIEKSVFWPKERICMSKLQNLISSGKGTLDLKPFLWIGKVSELYLYNMGINLNERFVDGGTIFHRAAANKDGRILKCILG